MLRPPAKRERAFVRENCVKSIRTKGAKSAGSSTY
jgi:hypothetical protein